MAAASQTVAPPGPQAARHAYQEYASEGQLSEFVDAIRDVVTVAETSPASWTEALGMARRAVKI